MFGLSALVVTSRYLAALVGLVVGPFVAVGAVLVSPVGVSAGGVVLALFGGGAVGAVGGFRLGRRRDARAWASMGRDLGLTPEESDGGLFAGPPDLTGTVDGRHVRVGQRSTSASGSGGGVRIYTQVAVAVDPPATEGALITRRTRSQRVLDDLFDGKRVGDEAALRSTVADAGSVVVEDSPFAVVAPSGAVARAVVSGRARELLLDADVREVRVGDPSHAYDAATAAGDGPAGAVVSGTVDGLVGGDPATVSEEGRFDLLTAAETERRIEALSAVAETFEVARERATDRPTSGDVRSPSSHS